MPRPLNLSLPYILNTHKHNTLGVRCPCNLLRSRRPLRHTRSARVTGPRSKRNVPQNLVTGQFVSRAIRWSSSRPRSVPPYTGTGRQCGVETNKAQKFSRFVVSALHGTCARGRCAPARFAKQIEFRCTPLDEHSGLLDQRILIAGTPGILKCGRLVENMICSVIFPRWISFRR